SSPVDEMAAKAPRRAPDLKDDFPSWFAECTVRAVELRLRRLSPGERDAALISSAADGYTLVRPLYDGLAPFEKSEPSMRNYFPELVRGIDAKMGTTRAAGGKYAVTETGESGRAESP